MFAASLGRELRRIGHVLWRATQALLRASGAAFSSAGRWIGIRGRATADHWSAVRNTRATRRAARVAEVGDTPVGPQATAQPRVIPTERAPRRKRRLGLLRLLGYASAVVLLFVAAMVIATLVTLPDLDEVRPGADNRLVFEDANGEPLVARGSVPSDYAASDRIPEVLRQAVIAIEDRRFMDHGGLDFRAILRAATRNLAAGSVVEGGSTLTQQLVKITYLDPERTFSRKLHEALLTLELERKLGKDEILTRYLNSVYLGAGATGMPAAARVYFDTDIADLTPAKAAALAAMIRAPSAVNPFSDLERLRERAALVIDLMRGQGYLDDPAANAARAELATMAPRRPASAYGSWFPDWVVKEADRLSTGFSGVVTLRTTLDPAVQTLAEQAVDELMDASGSTAEAALIAMTPEGEIVAMVGGRDYQASQFNRATDALRAPGSTFKTFVYLTALAQGYRADDRIEDGPVNIDGYEPQNFGKKYNGVVTLDDAFTASMNAATVKLAMVVGLDAVIDTARRLGIESDLTETPSLALGASGVTLIDMTEAYAGLASGQIPVQARGISGLKASGDGTLYSFDRVRPDTGPEAEALLRVRPEMVRMLARVVSDGTGKAAALPGGAAGKTGTSQDFRDALFIGWNGTLVTGVWVGNDDNSPMNEVTGGGLPAQIWQRFMAAATVPGAAGATEATTLATTLATSGTTVEPSSRPAPAVTGPTCNIRSCERAYRSFRASDCSFQPYRGGRKLCTR